tara:strand:+ start:5201 stop:5353 length:153 start_codon:yes stop_codon:yes gene_type:complete
MRLILREEINPFPRPPVRPNGSLRGLPQKQIPSSKISENKNTEDQALDGF